MDSPVQIDIRPVWRFRAKGERELDFTLLALLEALEREGKLTIAAQKAGISYRHAWNLIESWAGLLGAPLVEMERGRGTRLSTLGAKMLWAGKRAQAKLGPELDNLASEFASALNDSIAGRQPALRVHASHDFALARLRDAVNKEGGKVGIELIHRGSAEALASLRRGSCDLAGFHVADGPLGARAALRYSTVLRPRQHRLIGVATRTQGLIVARGNPKNVQGVADLAGAQLRFINRQRDSGTRILLEQLLQSESIDPADIPGFENEEYTHAAVAAHIASGLADVGLGIEAAAAQFNLGFVPIVTEHYFFAVHKDALQRPEVQAFVEILRSEQFRDILASLPGYRAERTGEVVAITDTPPWDSMVARPWTGA
jgi:molybdate transport repressor ModE-like protein